MGLDFVRRAAPTFTKAWNRSKKNLAQPTLFTLRPECLSRTVIADLDNINIAEGSNVILYAQEEKLILLSNNNRVGEIKNPPADIYSAIHEVGDFALGNLIHINKLSGTADVKIEQ